MLNGRLLLYGSLLVYYLNQCVLGLCIQPRACFRQRTRLEYTNEELDWDCGEVSWFQEKDDPSTTLYHYRETSYPSSSSSSLKTPLNEIIQSDQIILASTSAIVKSSYKEIFRLDILVSELDNALNSRVFVPYELFILTFLSGLYLAYNKTKKAEMSRLYSLYRSDQTEEYFQRYRQFRKIVTIVFVFISCLLTRNVQVAI